MVVELPLWIFFPHALPAPSITYFDLFILYYFTNKLLRPGNKATSSGRVIILVRIDSYNIFARS